MARLKKESVKGSLVVKRKIKLILNVNKSLEMINF